MSFFGKIFKRQTVNLAHPKDPVIRSWFAGDDDAGDVTSHTAMGVPAVYACVSVLAETMGSLPVGVWEVSGDQRNEARDHPVHALLNGRPCPHMTGPEWIEWVIANSALRGDAFCVIESNAAGTVTGLKPLAFNNVTINNRGDRLRYEAKTGDTVRRVYTDDEIFRLPWKIQADGTSLSPISLQRNSFAIALRSRNYLSNLLKNNSSPKGAIKLPTDISDEAANALVESWERRHQGPENSGKVAIFDGGMEWQSIGMSNEDAQFAELMQMSVADVARVFRVQPHKIGDLSKATFSNIEHQSIEFLTDTILPWVRRFEARLEAWALNDLERGRFSIEFNLRGLLRGDAAARSALYQTLFYTSAISPNEIRRLEGMNPIPGGDRYYIQSATVPADLIDQVAAGGTPAEDEMAEPPDTEDEDDV